MRWRFDGRCGSKYPLPDGAPTECDPEGQKPCCSELRRECGNTTRHCTCLTCIDYRDVMDWREAGFFLSLLNILFKALVVSSKQGSRL